MSASRFSGLTLHGVPLVFDTAPSKDTGFLVFLSKDEFQQVKAMGLEVSWLRPADKDDHAYAVLVKDA